MSDALDSVARCFSEWAAHLPKDERQKMVRESRECEHVDPMDPVIQLFQAAAAQAQEQPEVT